MLGRGRILTWIGITLLSCTFLMLLMGQDCVAQSDPCNPDPCQTIPKAVPETCTSVAGVCAPANDFTCDCEAGFTWQYANYTCEPPPPESFFSDDFESGLGKWLVSGWDWAISEPDGRCSVNYASESPEGSYPPHANSTMTSRHTVDLSRATAPMLTFWHRIGVYSSDQASVEISEDGGITWATLADFTNTWRSTWSLVQLDLTNYKTNRIKIQFRLRSNGDHETWGWDIDDVQIREMDTQEFTFPFADDFESGMGNWLVAGDSWGLTEDWYVSPTHSVGESLDGSYPRHANSPMILAHPIDLSGATAPVLTFWHKIGVYSSDHGYVEISEDGGFTWSVLADFTNTWRSTGSLVQLDLSQYKTTPVMVRFRLRTNGDHETWGWDIDDVRVKELH